MSHVTNERMRETLRGACTLNLDSATCGAKMPRHKYLGVTSVSDKDTQALQVLDRFASQVRWVVDSVMRSFDLPYDYRDEVEQEARILVISYADLTDTPIWGHGELASWTEQAEDDEVQIKSLLGRMLRMNLSQTIARQITKAGSMEYFSLDEMSDYGAEPSDDGLGERQMIDKIDNAQETDRVHRLYPTLARNVLDGMTQAEIADQDGIGHATVERRIAREKAAFLDDQERYSLIRELQAKGLMVDGSESLGELQEAAGYLKTR